MQDTQKAFRDDIFCHFCFYNILILLFVVHKWKFESLSEIYVFLNG